MKTPICDFVNNYLQNQSLRFHMPGHKGTSIMGCEPLDITEVDGGDVLYHEEGIIAQSQKNAATLFGSAQTVYSTEGSSLAIRGMVCLLKQYANNKQEKPLILAGRNAHKTFVTAAALMDVPVEWLFSEIPSSSVVCTVTPQSLEARLSSLGQKPTAVYVTSPDYLGNMVDVAGLAEVCNRHGVLLAVDNAHGAYLRFLQPSQHPLDQGAHLCCDSAHKTLPALTGCAYLHVGKNAPAFFTQQAKNAMSLFATTSPSYLILQSLDWVNRYLDEEYPQTLQHFVSQISQLKQRLTAAGYSLVGQELLKITLAPKNYGYTGDDLADVLQQQGIVCEFHDPDYLVLMVTPQVGEKALEKVEKVLCTLPKQEPLPKQNFALPPPQVVMTMHQALFAPSEELPLAQCEGRVLSAPTVSCPPAVPLGVCGELMTPRLMEQMEYYGHTTCRVVKQRDGQ